MPSRRLAAVTNFFAGSARRRTVELLFLMLVGSADAGAVLDRVRASGAVRVCIWSGYYGVTYRNPRNRALSGVDIDLSGEFARKLGVKLAYVESSFVQLVEDLRSDRCDIAMYAIAITPQRQEVLRFSQPYLRSDVYAITTRTSRTVKAWEDIDKPGINVAVQAGTFMEILMADLLRSANLVVIQSPKSREQELESGRVDVFMTNYPYGRRMLDNSEWARMIAPPRPIYQVPYGYAVKPGDDEWLRSVDDFVVDIKRDGSLERAAKKFGLSEIVVRQ
jgi:cyclohexadienyl dehydratase